MDAECFIPCLMEQYPSTQPRLQVSDSEMMRIMAYVADSVTVNNLRSSGSLDTTWR